MTTTNKFKPGIAIPVGETIKEVMEEQQVTLAELANAIDLNEELTKGLLEGSVRLTSLIANQLERLFHIPQSFWLNLEYSYNETIIRLWSESKETEVINESKS